MNSTPDKSGDAENEAQRRRVVESEMDLIDFGDDDAADDAKGSGVADADAGTRATASSDRLASSASSDRLASKDKKAKAVAGVTGGEVTAGAAAAGAAAKKNEPNNAGDTTSTDNRTAETAKADKSAEPTEEPKKGKRLFRKEAREDRSALVGVSKRLLVALWLVAIVVSGVAIWQGISYGKAVRAQHRAELRDHIAATASRVIADSMRLSVPTFEDDMARMNKDSTGVFLDEQLAHKDQIFETLKKEKARTDAQVSNAAVSEMDPDAGTAAVVLVYTANWYKDDKLTAAARQASRVGLQREGEGDDAVWKVSEMTPVGPQVPVGPSSESVQGLGTATNDAPGGANPKQNGGKPKPPEKNDAAQRGVPQAPAAPKNAGR